MSDPNRQHGIENEPHLRASGFASDSTEEKAARQLARERAKSTDADRVEHTVWSEPALSPDLAGQPADDQLTYERWLTENIRRTSWAKSFWITLLVAFAAGPWGVLGAIGSGSGSIFQVLMLTVFGPVVEEITKVAAALWVVEKRPFLFRSMGQILLCAVCGGLAFASIENLIYMYVYVPNHTPEFVEFRWTVCVGLHVSCSFVAGIGLVRIWDNAIRNLQPPRLALGVPWLVIAMGGHGLYNLSVTFATAAGWIDLGMPEPSAP